MTVSGYSISMSCFMVGCLFLLMSLSLTSCATILVKTSGFVYSFSHPRYSMHTTVICNSLFVYSFIIPLPKGQSWNHLVNGFGHVLLSISKNVIIINNTLKCNTEYLRIINWRVFPLKKSNIIIFDHHRTGFQVALHISETDPFLLDPWLQNELIFQTTSRTQVCSDSHGILW